jgi:hypothetical protein
MINLVYHLQAAQEHGENGHPLETLESLGLTYIVATPQSLYDSWWLWGCKNVPYPLPPYLWTLDLSPDHPSSCLTEAEKTRLRGL